LNYARISAVSSQTSAISDQQLPIFHSRPLTSLKSKSQKVNPFDFSNRIAKIEKIFKKRHLISGRDKT